MTRLTNEQLLRGEKQFGANCVAFFPCNEGSGTTITDIMSGLVIADAGGTWADAHAFKLLVSDYDNSANYNLLDVANKHLLFVHSFKVFTSSAFGIFAIGNITGNNDRVYTMSGGSGFTVNDDSGPETAAAFGTPGTGDYLLAGTWNPVTGDVSSYEGVDGAAPALVNSSTANAARLALDGVIGNLEMTVNTVADQATYGIAIYAFEDGIPSDMLSALAHFSKNWRKGRKETWSAWKNVA